MDPDFSLEKEAWDASQLFYGFDEAGYGCAAGSMFVACVAFCAYTDPAILAGVRDSKKTSEKEREALAKIIMENAQEYKIWEISAEEMDSDQTYWLRYTKPVEWLEDSFRRKGITCFDGNKAISCKYHKNTWCIKGDGKSLSIAAASILAKCSKDLECKKLDIEYPDWGFANHAGYLTKTHIEKIKKLGPLPIHRSKYISKIMNK